VLRDGRTGKASKQAAGSATTVRVKETTRRRAASMAQNDGVTIGEIVDRALDAYESQKFWEQTRLALAAREDEPDPAWDVADRDGLET
jgi:hypothetical protein